MPALSLSGASFAASGQRWGSGALSGGYGSVTGLLTGTPFTVEMWFRRSGNPGSLEVIAGQQNAWFVALQANGTLLVRYGSAAGAVIDLTGSAVVTDGAWHWIALSVDGTTVHVLLDGTVAGSAGGVGAAAADFRVGTFNGVVTGTLGVGNFGGNPGFPFGGQVDEVAVWGTARYAAATTPPASAYAGSEAGLLALWHLDGNGGDSKGAGWLGPLVLGFVGDSITDGRNGSAVAPCASYLSGLGYAVTAVNRGVGGAGTADWLPGGSLFGPALSAMQAAGVTDILLMLGTNDARTPNAFTAAQHAAGMAQVVGGLVAAGLRVTLNKPIWTVPGTDFGSGVAWPAEVNALYRDYYAAALRLVDGVGVFQGDTGAHQAFRLGASMLGDGVHPADQAANDVLGQHWATGFLHRMGASGTGRGVAHIGGGIF